MKSPEDRFWAKVNKSSAGCWEWTAYRQRFGYGSFAGTDGRTVLAHRFSWEIANGPIPDGLYVCHHCDNPPCVRPDHLFLGTARDNNDDKLAKGRGTPPPVHYGLTHPLVRTPDAVVKAAREDFARGLTTYEVADRYGLSQRTVMAWVHGRSRVAAGGPIHEPDPNWRRKLPQCQKRGAA